MKVTVGKYFVQNFGCRATQADGAALESLLAAKGLQASVDRIGADLVVLNTCTVTAAADDDVRQTIRRVHRENPAARILVTGCYAQRAPEELASLPGVEWVVGNSHKNQVAELVTLNTQHTPYHGNIHVGDIFAQHEFLTAPVEDAAGDRTPNLKFRMLQQPLFVLYYSFRARPQPLRSRQSVVDQVRALASRYREIVLSGINLGRWARNRQPNAAGRCCGALAASSDSKRRRRLAWLCSRILDKVFPHRDLHYSFSWISDTAFVYG